MCVAATLGGCNSANDSANVNTLFQLKPPSETGIGFSNNLSYTESLNTYTFKNFYNGGGVGVGDFNNDSLPDLFFSGNLVSNKLYLNRGNFKFEDISFSAGLNTEGIWTTGVSVVDINADGLLDIYICKSGPPGGPRRHNELFINQGDLTFKEEAKSFNLAFEGLSTHAAFFDYDHDGDLDCYLLNNSIRSVGGYDLRKHQRERPDSLGGNKLLRNDQEKFIDVTQDAGIYSSEIGFGLGVTIGDINLDGWPDIYVSNDFFEKDYLYINKHDGTFRESLEDYVREISLGSMGADLADINNDALPEIFVTEMLPESEHRLKTTSQFESWDKYRINVESGYYHQFSRNVLQLNNGNGSFSEISRFANVHATDWSWGALIFDMDNDGWKDIFVANGIFKDLLDQDYVNFIGNPSLIREMLSKDKKVIQRLVDSIPTNKLENYAFHNNRDLTFSNKAHEWGFSDPSHSNGSAYADLDNDGDLDLITSNVNMPAFVYENRADKIFSERTSISIVLKGESKNTSAIGARVILKAGSQSFYQELNPMRGFMSSVDHKLVFGLGNISIIDSLIVVWPDGDKVTTLTNVKANQTLRLDAAHGIRYEGTKGVITKPIFQASDTKVDFTHKENYYVDFDRDALLYNMITNEGPCICTGDANGDGKTDFYIGGAKGQPGALFVQVAKGFRQIASGLFEQDKDSEDTDCVFFDANGDGKQDLYVTSGSYEFSSSSSALSDRLYLNGGNDRFSKSNQLLPVSSRFESTNAVATADFDQDGDLDLFVGVRVIPFLYGVPGNGYILRNDGRGNFEDVTSSVAPGLKEIGMITDARWADINYDSLPDLVFVGEWMPIKVFLNKNGSLQDVSKEFGFEHSSGWYHAVEVADVNHDGFIDIVTGNHGTNSRFKADTSAQIKLFVNDFDSNGSVEHILTRSIANRDFPFALRNDLVKQIPSLKKKYLHYRNYAEQAIDDIFTVEQLKNAIILRAEDLQSAVWMNSGKGSFSRNILPGQAQFSPVYSINVDDFDGDGRLDILTGGNLYRAKPEAGIYDASYGLLLKGEGNGKFIPLLPSVSGVFITGEIRALQSISVGGKKSVLVGRNNKTIEILTLSKRE